MSELYPLRFEPIYRQYIWGGHRLRTLLGRPLDPRQTYAESWDLVDHDADQSCVEAGPLRGLTLHGLMLGWRQELLGPRELGSLGEPLCDRFPLLIKYLDAEKRLSLQVHPDDGMAARLKPPDLGKTEAWVVLAAERGSVIYAGLKPGVDRKRLAEAVRQGTCEQCIHCFEAKAGDYLLLPPGTIHALGSGVLVAEIQRASDATFRLFDWNRLGPDGKPRPLHIQEALDATDYQRGPIQPGRLPGGGADTPLVLAECEWFVVECRRCDFPQLLGSSERFHIITVLEGSLEIAGDPVGDPMTCGRTVLLPASAGPLEAVPQGEALILDIYPPGPRPS